MKHFISFCFCLASFVPYSFCAQESPKYLDPNLPIDTRIDDLLPRMTVTEKAKGRHRSAQNEGRLARSAGRHLWRFNEPKEYRARFVYTIDTPEKVQEGQPFPATVTVRNEGNLTDVTEARLYETSQIGSWSFELKPGDEKSHAFMVAMHKAGNVAVVAGTEIVTRVVAVEGGL